MDDSHPDSWWLDCFKFLSFGLVSGDCRLVSQLLFEFLHFLVDSRCLLVLAQVFCLQPFGAVKRPQFLLYISLHNHPHTHLTLPLLFSLDCSPKFPKLSTKPEKSLLSWKVMT